MEFVGGGVTSVREHMVDVVSPLKGDASDVGRKRVRADGRVFCAIASFVWSDGAVAVYAFEATDLGHALIDEAESRRLGVKRLG